MQCALMVVLSSTGYTERANNEEYMLQSPFEHLYSVHIDFRKSTISSKSSQNLADLLHRSFVCLLFQIYIQISMGL